MANEPSKPAAPKVRSADPKPDPAPMKVRSKMQRTAMVRNYCTK